MLHTVSMGENQGDHHEKHLAVLILLVLSTLPLAAGILPFSQKDPAVDGIFGINEYPMEVQLNNMRIGYALSRDSRHLYFIQDAPTTGWVSIGLGSNRMHGAHIIIGFDAISNQVIREDTGRGHGHSQSQRQMLVQSKIKETGGRTTMEFTVPASQFDSLRNLSLIAAYGSKDDLRSKHVSYDSHTISFLR